MLLRTAAVPALDVVVDLGNTSARLVSNRATFAGMSFFSRQAILTAAAPAEYELWCIDDPDGSVRTRLQAFPPDSSYRAASFAIGYYATDHFGHPVVLHRFGHRHYVVGQYLERVMWTYFVKRFIFLSSLEQGHIFLKAACVAFGSHGVLILGRGSGGKTSLVRALCRSGAVLVTNSHAIVNGLAVTGVRTAMRVRGADQSSASLVAAGLRAGEVLIDPFDGGALAAHTPIQLQSLCIVDYRPGCDEGVQPLDAADVIAFAEQFSLGLNVYRLEEEMLEFYSHAIGRYGQAMRTLHDRLRSMVEALPCYLVRTDICDERNLTQMFAIIGWPRSPLT